MADAPSYTDLANAVGISASYANEIVKDRKDPPPPLAALIYRRTGWRCKLIEGLTEEQVAGIEALTPKAMRDAQQAAA